MERLAYLVIAFIKAYFVLYLAYKSIGFIFQPISNIIDGTLFNNLDTLLICQAEYT